MVYDSPIETLTFLVTDIEGSTGLLRRVGDRVYSDVLAQHHEIVRSSARTYRGREEGTQGDSFFLVFSSTSSCVAAAIEIQRRLAEHTWPEGEQLLVRMGIHTGEATETATGLVGYEVHRAARIAAVAHGGQVLLSAGAAGLVENVLPEDVSLRILGTHQLKDLGRPETIYQLASPGLHDVFPPLRSLENVQLPNNLPTSLSPFVGRAQELAQIRELVTACRLVTLTGTGGSGKTRLALQTAADLLDGSGEGVWFVMLDLISDPDMVVTAVIETLGLQKDEVRPSNESLVQVLRDQEVLIVLDNCEHVIDAVAKLADQIGRNCSGVRLIATSREPLGVNGEEVYRVRSLTLPEGVVETIEDLRGSDAVDLFIARAQSHDKSFTLDVAGAPVVASICRRLDGIPLAIELAAARLSALSLVDLHKHLDMRFRLLTGGSRSALPRQQTLGAMVSWSYDLLSESERAVLRRLSVFVGGFDLDAVEAVCSSEEMPSFEIIDLVSSLVNKSLVVAERDASSVRFHLLETIRQFAAEQLMQVDGATEVSEVRRRHANYYLSLSQQSTKHLYGGAGQIEWFTRLDAEWGNVQSAFVHFSERDDYAAILQLQAAVGVYLLTRRLSLPAPAVLHALEVATEVNPLIRARAQLSLANLMGTGRLSEGGIDDSFATQHFMLADCLETSRQHRDDHLTTCGLMAFARVVQREEQPDEAGELISEALALARRSHDDYLIGSALVAFERILPGPLEPTETLNEAVTHLRAAQDRVGLARALHLSATRSWNHSHLGDPAIERSVAMEEEALTVAQSIGNDLNAAEAIGNIGIASFAMGNVATGEDYTRRCLLAHRGKGEPDWQASCIIFVLAYCAAHRGDVHTGAQLFGAAQRLREEFPPFGGFDWATAELEMIDLHRDMFLEKLGDRAFKEEVAVGRGLTKDQMYRLALGRTR